MTVVAYGDVVDTSGVAPSGNTSPDRSGGRPSTIESTTPGNSKATNRFEIFSSVC